MKQVGIEIDGIVTRVTIIGQTRRQNRLYSPSIQ